MKIFLLLAMAATGLFASGCRTVAVVEDRHHRSHGAVSVSYYEGRPYYYSGRSRVWGYPPGYRGSRTYVAPAPVHRGATRTTVYY